MTITGLKNSPKLPKNNTIRKTYSEYFLNLTYLKELFVLSDKVMKKLISSDPLSKEVYNSIINFRNLSIKRSEVSELKFLEARSKFVI